MAEITPSSHEHHHAPNHTPEAHHHVEHHNETDTTSERDPLQNSLEALRARVDAQAVSSKETPFEETKDTSTGPAHDQSLHFHQHLKHDAYRRTLNKIQSHLSPLERVESRFIHHPTVEIVSDSVAKTIGRPIALLSGSIVALLGSIYVLYLSKHVGFHYNYSLILLLFVGGLLAGLITELILKLVRKHHHND